jgi:hypothetical protein
MRQINLSLLYILYEQPALKLPEDYNDSNQMWDKP